MNDIQSILDAVNTFYRDAFANIIYVLIGLMAVAGALVPAIIAFLQNRSLKKESKNYIEKIEIRAHEIELNLQKRIDELIKTSSKSIEDEISSRLAATNLDIQKASSAANAGIYHLQANQFLSQNRYADAVESAFTSASAYIDAEEEFNMQRVLNTASSSLDKIDKKQFESIQNFDEQFNSFITKLEEINEKSRYYDLISKLKKKFRQAREREPKEKTS